MTYSHLLPPSWKSQVAAWLHEDTPSFDYGGFVVGEAPREAFLLGKGSKPAVLAGAPFVDEIFNLLDCTYASQSCVHMPSQLISPLDAAELSGTWQRVTNSNP
jgi:nicotinate-nucleotide pyrophosphorylase